MSLRCVCALSAAIVLVCAHAARAEEITFNYTLNSGNYPPISASFPDTVELSLDGDSGYTESVTQHIGTETTQGKILFTGFDFVLTNDTRISVSQEIFDSSKAVFVLGTFTDAELYNPYPESQTGLPEGSGLEGTLVITESAGPSSVTPEPSSVALLGTGLLAIAGVARKRFAYKVKAHGEGAPASVGAVLSRIEVSRGLGGLPASVMRLG